MAQKPSEFPCTLRISLPFPTARLASTAKTALSVDPELSPLVNRFFSIDPSSPTVLLVDYVATTNRMLRVAVNGFFESVGVVLGVMEELDVDTYTQPDRESLQGIQGIEEAA